MRFLLASLVVLLLAACVSSDVRYVPPRAVVTTPARTIPVLVDRAFDAQDQAAIAEAAAEWTRAFGGAIVLATRTTDLRSEDLNGHGIVIQRVDSSCPYIPSTRYAKSENLYAWTERVGGRRVWIVRDRMGSWQVKAVAMHELGHTLGADDRETPGLMYKFFTQSEYQCIDAETAHEVSGLLGIPVGHCEPA